MEMPVFRVFNRDRHSEEEETDNLVSISQVQD